MRRLAQSALATLFLLAAVGGASALDNGTGPSREDIVNACNASYSVCKAACQRPKSSFSGQLAQSYCVDDCYNTWKACVSSLKATGKTKQRPKGVHQ